METYLNEKVEKLKKEIIMKGKIYIKKAEKYKILFNEYNKRRCQNFIDELTQQIDKDSFFLFLENELELKNNNYKYISRLELLNTFYRWENFFRNLNKKFFEENKDIIFKLEEEERIDMNIKSFGLYNKLEEEIEKLKRHYDIKEYKHAIAILKTDFQNEFIEILNILNNFKLLASDILKPGGSKSPIANKIDSQFYSKGWEEVEFDTKFILQKKQFNKNTPVFGNEEIHETPTHKIDCFKNRIAFEIEWNNKTEFYDRDLNNFRLLFDLNAISVGIILTRATCLDDIFKELQSEFQKENPEKKSKLINKYGASSTHMDKLIPRIEGRSAGGCPLLIIGISEKTYKNDLIEKS